MDLKNLRITQSKLEKNQFILTIFKHIISPKLYKRQHNFALKPPYMNNTPFPLTPTHTGDKRREPSIGTALGTPLR